MARISPQDQAAAESAAYKKHVVGKIRSEWGNSVPGDADDDEILGVWADLNVPPDATTEEINDVLDEVYASDYLPPKLEDKRTFMEKAQDVGSAIAPAVGPIAANIGAAASAAIPAMSKVAGGLGKTVPAQLGMAGYYGTKLAGAQLAANPGKLEGLPVPGLGRLATGLEQTAERMPMPDVADLKRRGYSAGQIRNILKGYTATQQSLMEDVGQTGREGVATSVEALANAAVLPMTAGALESAAGGIAGRAIMQGGASKLAGQAVGKIAGRAAGGALIGGTFGGTANVVERAAEAVEKGGGADEVLGYMTNGLLGSAPKPAVEGEETPNVYGDFGKGFGDTWAFGAAFGGAVGAVESAAQIARGSLAAREMRKLEALKQARTTSVTKFGEDFKPDDLIQRFGTDLVEADAAGLDDVTLAAKLMSKMHPDMAATEAGLRATALIAEKIKPWRQWKAQMEGAPPAAVKLQPETPAGLEVRPVPPGQQGIGPQLEAPPTAQGVVPIGEPLAPNQWAGRGGMAPEPNAPAALQGPLGGGPDMPAFVPPVGVRQMAVEPPIAAPGVAQAFPEVTPEVSVPTGEAPLAPTVVAPPVNPRGIVPENLPPAVQGPLGSDRPVPFAPPSAAPRAEGIEFGKLPVKDIDNAVAAVKIKPPKGVEIDVVPGEGGTHLELKKLAKIDEGSSEAALKHVVRNADEYGLPVQARLTPQAGPKGGRIPVEKLKAWYEKQGFKVVEEGEGFAVVRREPIGALQSAAATRLEQIAAAAQRRLDSRVGRLSAGVDPADIRDHALVLAADMFSQRLRNRAAIETWAVQKWGEAIRPQLDKIVAQAQKHFTRMFKHPATAEKNLKTLLDLGMSGRHGANWYEGTADWARKNFGEDADMMLRFLAVTSANGQTESGSAMALKAFAQWKAGMPFEGFRGDSMVGQLNKAVAGESLGEHTKIQNFYDALRGDPNAVVLDRWMIDALNLKTTKGSLRENDYRIYAQVVDDLAEMNNMTPRQFQAAVWEGARIRKAHMTEKTGGRALTTKSGSARPLEELVQRKLAGMSIDEYIAANHGNLKQMERMYQALAPVRKGESDGYTFNPKTWETDTKGGFLTSLASNVVARNELYPATVLKFAQQVAPILKQHPDRHFTIGVFKMPDGNYSLDLNMTMPSKEEAVKLAFKNRQYAVGHLADGGEYLGDVPTGYDPKKHGAQFLPPKDPSKRVAWLRSRVASVNRSLSGDDLFEE